MRSPILSPINSEIEYVSSLQEAAEMASNLTESLIRLGDVTLAGNAAILRAQLQELVNQNQQERIDLIPQPSFEA